MALPATSSFPQSGSILSRWKLDEASGTRADSVGPNTLSDPSSVGSTTGQFSSNSAVFVSASNDYLSVADTVALSFTGDFSIGMWFKKTADSYFASKYTSSGNQKSWLLGYGGDSGSTGLFLYINPNGDDSGRTIAGSGVSLSDSTWYHVVVVYDNAGTVQFYVNGAASGSLNTSQATSIFNGSAPFLLGGFNSSGQSNCELQDAVLWTGVSLSGAEVTTYYNSYFPAEGQFMTLNRGFW